jgi:peptidoglycan hydrolase CwlO-like protein
MQPSPSSLSNPTSTCVSSNVDSSSLMNWVNNELNRRLAGLGDSEDAEKIAVLEKKVETIAEKQTKDSSRLDTVNSGLEKVKKELAELDAPRLKKDVEKLHS